MERKAHCTSGGSLPYYDHDLEKVDLKYYKIVSSLLWNYYNLLWCIFQHENHQVIDRQGLPAETEKLF